MHFWDPGIDPAHPLDCTQAEAYALKKLQTNAFLALAADGGLICEVDRIGEAFLFHTHEAALRVARELQHLGYGPVDVVKHEG